MTIKPFIATVRVALEALAQSTAPAPRPGLQRCSLTYYGTPSKKRGRAA